MCFHYSNKVTGIYELSLCKIADTGSPGKIKIAFFFFSFLFLQKTFGLNYLRVTRKIFIMLLKISILNKCCFLFNLLFVKESRFHKHIKQHKIDFLFFFKCLEHQISILE